LARLADKNNRMLIPVWTIVTAARLLLKETSGLVGKDRGAAFF
jgi:hypothetical protein